MTLKMWVRWLEYISTLLVWIIIIIKFISQHNKVKQNHNNRKKIQILAKWPTQDETTYVWPIQQNNRYIHAIARYRNTVGKLKFYQAEQN